MEELDPERANTLQQSSGQDKNKRRLIRALEIVAATGKPVPKFNKVNPLFDTLMIGVKRSPEELKKRIRKRLLYRIDHGMLNEVKNLHQSGLSWRRLEELGLEYRFVAQYLQKKISKQEMVDSIQRESEDFVRRQMLWFKRDPRIYWIESEKEAEKLVQKFL